MEPSSIDLTDYDAITDDFGNLQAAPQKHPFRINESFMFSIGSGLYLMPGDQKAEVLPLGTAETVIANVQQLLGERQLARVEVSVNFGWGLRASRSLYRETDFSTKREGKDSETMSADGVLAVVSDLILRYPDVTSINIEGTFA